MPLRVNNLRLAVDHPEELLRDTLAKTLGVPPSDVSRWRILRKSLDARSRHELAFVYSAAVELHEDEERVIWSQRVPHIESYVSPHFDEPVEVEGALRTLDDGYEPERCLANTQKFVDEDVFPKAGKMEVAKEGEPMKDRIVVQDYTKKILGVTCTVVLDRVYVNNKLEEKTLDFFAQDKLGNVWYFGEDSKELKKGRVADTKGSWEGGVKGAQPGIVMHAHPQPGDPYRQEYMKGEAEDMGQVLSVKETVKVPAGDYQNCVKTKDWSAIETGNIEHKFYSKEVGNVVLETEGNDTIGCVTRTCRVVLQRQSTGGGVVIALGVTVKRG
jgi:hypothetical protein